MDQNNTDYTVRVLLIDDDEEDYLIIKRLFTLMKGIHSELEWVSNSEDGIRIIREARHDAYLVDYRLDARTGFDVLQEVRAAERSEPFILLTGISDQDIERESLQMAASDYLVKKNLTSEGLARAIYYALGRKEQEKQKIDQLVELNRTKDEFISIASHQLRTPATTVKQYVAMVLDGLSGDVTVKQRQLLEKAYDSNERQLTIINDLLKVAQIDAGRMELVLSDVNLSELMRQIVADFVPTFEQSQQLLTADIPPRVTARCDENALRMVVDNLLENARKYSPEHATTTLTVRVEAHDIVIEVSDQGVGVTHPDRLFQKFSRIPNERSTIVGGTGLGLYWAQSIAKLHGGELRYHSQKSGGSQFSLILPNV